VSRKFYQNLVGAKLLNRPKFPTNGFWLWLGNVQLHLIQSDLSVPPDHPDGGTKVNHFSFDVYDFEDCERRLKAAGVEYKKVYVPEGDRGINQIFFQDPDLHWIELCDCHKMGDFIFGDFDEVRATEISKFYSEGVDLAAPFIATCVLLLMGSRYTHKPGAGNPSRLFEIFQTYAGDDNKISQAELGRMLGKHAVYP
jgi:catechol 2,3-dioxygenase-like lactoylglutathione lyase family enzyme